MQVGLLNEERVALGFAVDQLHQFLRGGLPGQVPQHCANSVEGEPTQAHLLHQVAMRKLLDHTGQRMVRIYFD